MKHVIRSLVIMVVVAVLMVVVVNHTFYVQTRAMQTAKQVDYYVTMSYTVEEGDSLYRLAERQVTSYHSNITEIIRLIRDLNRLPNYEINIGDTLLIPCYSR